MYNAFLSAPMISLNENVKCRGVMTFIPPITMRLSIPKCYRKRSDMVDTERR